MDDESEFERDELGLPAERWWRHPSEMAASAAAPPPPAPQVNTPRFDWRRHSVTTTVGVSAAAAGVAVLLLAPPTNGVSSISAAGAMNPMLTVASTTPMTTVASLIADQLPTSGATDAEANQTSASGFNAAGFGGTPVGDEIAQSNAESATATQSGEATQGPLDSMDLTFTDEGMVVDRLTQGGAAEMAGIRPGDIIVAMTTPVNQANNNPFQMVLSRRSPAAIQLTLLRPESGGLFVVTLPL